MQKLPIGIVAVAALWTTSAFAADMALKAPPPAPAPAWTWTGFYVGGNVGYGQSVNSDPRMSFVDNSGALTGYIAAGGIVPVAVNPRGVIGGVQAGYNFQSANVVYGLVADIQDSGMKAASTFVSFNSGITRLRRELEWFGTVRGRVGLAQQNWLLYGTGGLAYGQIHENLTFNLGGTTGSGSSSQTRAGWTLGAGVEYGVTHWSFGIEYLYVDLGRSSVTEGIAPAPIDYVTMSSRNTSNIIRALASYRF